MSSNTKKRIFSALGIVGGLLIILSLGREVTQVFAFLCWGVLITDEILTNFLKLERKSNEYMFSYTIYGVLVALFFGVENENFSKLLIFLNIIQNIYLLMFLFKKRNHTLNIFRSLREVKFLTSFFVFLPVHSVVYSMNNSQWILIFLGLILLVGSTDTMGWLVGKNFGKHKLWPAVSPKKTIEGALGSLISAPLLLTLYWGMFIGKAEWYLIPIFIVLTIFTIIGDLVQSKLKRRFSLKDSSTLIPGHGGVYDRSDSLLFVAPFYSLFVSLVV